MRRFLRDVTVFVGLQVAILAALDGLYMARYGRQHYLASFVDKAERLERTPSPRILLVGGSSWAFGTKSAVLERATGRPVVNLGVHAGFGLAFMLAQAAEAARGGDLLILAPEYALLEPGEFMDTAVLQLQMRLAPQSARFLSARHLPRLLDTGLFPATDRLKALRSFLRGQPADALYNRASFNANGDMVGHHSYGSWKANGQHVLVPGPEGATGAIAQLAEFARTVRARGADVLIVPAPIPADDYESQRERAAALWAAVARDSGIEVVGARRTYSRDLFFDTAYHLTLEGKLTRTRALVRVVQHRQSPVRAAATEAASTSLAAR